MKFRVWDNIDKEYISEIYIDQIFADMNGRVVWWSSDKGHEDVTDRLTIEFSFIHRGKEFYENDIVDWKNGRGYVVFSGGQFRHSYQEKINGKLTGDYRPSKSMWDEVVTIGNLNENPDLLK